MGTCHCLKLYIKTLHIHTTQNKIKLDDPSNLSIADFKNRCTKGDSEYKMSLKKDGNATHSQAEWYTDFTQWNVYFVNQKKNQPSDLVGIDKHWLHYLVIMVKCLETQLSGYSHIL